jgi:peptidylprolyl isomerase
LIAKFADTASASGEQVSDGGGTLPTVTSTSGSAPTDSIPSTLPPSNLIVKTLIKGSGPPVTDGEEPFSFQIGVNPAQVIKGWNIGLLGVPVGSRVLLVVPPADGCGSAGSSSVGIEGTDALVFVVDVPGAFDAS